MSGAAFLILALAAGVGAAVFFAVVEQAGRASLNTPPDDTPL